MPTPAPMAVDLSQSKLPHIFADEVGIALQLKARQLSPGKFEKEGHIILFFMDAIKQQAVGEFVISEFTAKDLIAALTQTIASLDKELASTAAPQQPQVRTTGSDSSYR